MDSGRTTLRVFAILIALRALTDVLKPLGAGSGFVFFGKFLTGAACYVLAPIVGVVMLIYAYGLWQLRRFAMPMGIANRRARDDQPDHLSRAPRAAAGVQHSGLRCVWRDRSGRAVGHRLAAGATQAGTDMSGAVRRLPEGRWRARQKSRPSTSTNPKRLPWLILRA